MHELYHYSPFLVHLNVLQLLPIMLCLLAQFQRQDSFSSTSSGDSGTPIDGPYDYDSGVIGHMETVAYKVGLLILFISAWHNYSLFSDKSLMFFYLFYIIL